jgi:hypothetical protein
MQMLKTVSEAQALDCPYNGKPCSNAGCMAWDDMGRNTGFCFLLNDLGYRGQVVADRMCENNLGYREYMNRSCIDQDKDLSDRMSKNFIDSMKKKFAPSKEEVEDDSLADYQNIFLIDEDVLTLCGMMRDAIAFQIGKAENTFLGLKEKAKIIDRYSFVKAAVMGQFVEREVKFRTEEERTIKHGYDNGL